MSNQLQPDKALSQREAELHSFSRSVYEERIEAGVAREQARKDLPLSTYTEAYWKIDLHNLLHFLALRMDSHAQHEIRQYANVIGYEIVSKWVPLTWEAFQEYRLNSMALSSSEILFLSLIHSGNQEELLDEMQKRGWLKQDEGSWKPNREAKEFSSKLDRLGLTTPWV